MKQDPPRKRVNPYVIQKQRVNPYDSETPEESKFTGAARYGYEGAYQGVEPSPRLMNFIGHRADYLQDLVMTADDRFRTLVADAEFNKQRYINEDIASKPLLDRIKFNTKTTFEDQINFSKSIADKIGKTTGGIANFLVSPEFALSPAGALALKIAPMLTSTKEMYQQQGAAGMTAGMAEGLIDMVSTLPIEFVTNTTRMDGKAVVNTPEMAASKFLEFIGTGAMFAYASGMSRVLLPDLTNEGAMQYMRKKTLSNFGEVISKEAFIGISSGGIQAGIAQLGEEDYAGKVFGASLAMLPVSVLFGLYKGVTRGKGAAKIATQTVGVESLSAADDAANLLRSSPEAVVKDPYAKGVAWWENATSERKEMWLGRPAGKLKWEDLNKTEQASIIKDIGYPTNSDAFAINGLKIDKSDSMLEVLSNTDAFATADNLIDGLIHSRINIGKGVVVPRVSMEKITELQKYKYLDSGNSIIGPNGTVFIKPKDVPISKEHAAFFKKVGFFPDEIVVLEDGTSFRIDRLDKDKNVVLSGIASGGKEITLSPTALDGVRRTGNTMDFTIMKKFSNSSGSFMTTVGPNVGYANRGELPYRVSGFAYMVNEDTSPKSVIPVDPSQPVPAPAKPVVLGHEHFATFEEAVKYAEEGYIPSSSPSGGRYAPFHMSPLQMVDNIQVAGGKTKKVSLIFETGTETISKKVVKGIKELNSESYFDMMYDHFKASGFDAVNGIEPFTDLYYKFTSSMGIASRSDQTSLINAFYTRIQKEVLAAVDEPTRIMHQKVSKQMQAMAEDIRKDKGNAFYQAASTNGLYIVPRGAGRYDIKFVGSGETLKTVGSAVEGINAIGSEFGEMKGVPDLDGGGGQIIPPAALSPGGNASVPIQSRGHVTWLDRKNAEAFGQALTPPMRVFTSLDEYFGTNISTTIGLPLQHALENVQNLMRGKEGRVVVDAATKIKEARKNFNVDESEIVQNYTETISIAEKEAGMSSTSIQWAEATAKLDADDLADFMYDVKIGGDHEPVGSPKFEKSFAAVVAQVDENGVPKYNAQITSWARLLWTNPVFATESIPSIIRLAILKRNPLQALSKVDYAAKYFVGPKAKQMMEYAKLIEDAQTKGELYFGVKFKSAHETKSYVGGGGDPLYDTPQSLALMSEQAEMGHIARNQLVRDPAQLFNYYMMAGFRTMPKVKEGIVYAQGSMYVKLSSRDIFKRVKEEKLDAIENIIDLSQVPKDKLDLVKNNLKDITNKIKLVVNQHISDTRGIPRIDTALSNAMQRLFGEQFGVKVNTAIQWTTLAYMGGRPVFGLRDITSAGANMMGNHGLVFTSRVMNDLITGGEMKALVKEGVFPDPGNMDYITPTDNVMEGVSKLSKATHLGIKLSAQPWIYARLAAGIYRVTRDDVAKFGSDYVRSSMDEATKTKLINQLDLDLVPTAIVDDIFTRLSSIGSGVEGAADVLGRWRIRSNLNVFGNHNSPMAWQGTVGKLMGHMGSWGANEAQTLNDMWNRGSGARRAGRIMRYTASQAAILAVGYETGLDLANWMISPIGLYGVGPIPTTIGKAAFNSWTAMMSNNAEKRANGQRLMERMSPVRVKWEGRSIPEILQLDQFYLPFGAAANDWLKSIDALNRGFGLGQALFRGIGTQLDLSNQSPLQQMMGNNPVGKTGNFLQPKPMIPFTQP
jgi:hypothetical protein